MVRCRHEWIGVPGPRERGPQVRAVDRLGAWVLGGARTAYLLVGFLYLSAKMLWVGRYQGPGEVLRQVLLQVYFTGVQGVAPVAGLAVMIGFLVMAHAFAAVGRLAGGEELGQLIAWVVLGEVGPLLTAGVVIVRSVTAIAAELGLMRVQREIEALEVMGISPMLHLVTPRLAGGLAALLALNVVFTGVAVVTGLTVAAWLPEGAPAAMLSAVLGALTPERFVALAGKVVIGGLGVLVIACYHGMEVTGSPTEVPVAVSRAALRALVFLVVWHAVVSLGGLGASGGGLGRGL